MTFRMDFCDLIVSMEQAEISPRPVVGAIVVVSGLAVSFLLWLLYVHHAHDGDAARNSNLVHATVDGKLDARDVA